MRDQVFPENLGFRNEPFTVHTSRTIMLNELTELLQNTTPDTSRDEYLRLITESNLLAKPTISSRNKAAKYISNLYSLSPDCAIFRGLRFFWERDSDGHPLLAVLCAHSRDSLLRAAASVILSTPLDSNLPLDVIKQKLEDAYPGRLSPRTLRSTAQNISSTFQQSGHLLGHRTKIRTRPNATPGTAAYSLFIGYLSGSRGENLLNTYWSSLLDVSKHRISDLAREAHRLGWMTYRNAGSVIEVSFNHLLSKKEKEVLSE